MSRLQISISRLTVAVCACFLLAIPSFADSQARVVRLSDVQGDVQIDRSTGQGFEKAFLNLPVIQGAKIQTKEDARAEVEFEDGSTLRLTPVTVIDFPQLSLRDSGAKVSSVHLQEGTAYVNFAGAKNDEFTLTFGHEKVSLTHAAHLRVEMGDTEATVAVFKGDARVESPTGTVDVSKNRTVTFNLADKDRYTLAKDVEPDPYDAWDKSQDQYHERYVSNNSYSSPYAYGASDLNYYGSYSNVPGYGTMWQPYFIGAGWDPFMSGAWAFYPGYGYSWVSGYPWGWTPYHSGSWVFVPGHGWMWQPGSSWAGLNVVPRVLNQPANFRPPQPPPNGGQQVVPISRGPAPRLNGFNRIDISENSAGMGIPRGSVRNLSQLSLTAQQTGFATARVHTAPIGNSSWWRGGYDGPAASRPGISTSHGSVSSGRTGGTSSAAHASSGSHSSGHR